MSRGDRDVPPITSSLEPPGAFITATFPAGIHATSFDSTCPLGPSSDGDSDQEIVYSLSPDDDLCSDAYDHHEPGKPPSLPPTNQPHVSNPTSDYSVDALPSEIGVTEPQGASTDSRSVPSSHVASRTTLRGGATLLASPRETSVISPLAGRAARYCSKLTPVLTNGPQRPKKRAVVVGINYNSSRHDRGKRLYYAVNDARRVASSLKAWGFSDEAVLVLTDEEGQGEREQATHGVLMSSIDWLLRDAKAGELLVFFFSGHGCPESSSLVMADGKQFGRDLLRDRLVLPVPAGCVLHVILDCCSASSMIELQYCVGRMFPNCCAIPPSVPPKVQTNLLNPLDPMIQPLSQPVPQSSSGMAFAGSLSATPSVNNTRSDQIPVMSGLGASVPGGSVGLHWGTARQGTCVVAALPLLNCAETQTSCLARSILLMYSGAGQAPIGQSVATSQTMPAQGSHRGKWTPVRGTHVPDYFYKRPAGFVKPGGTVMLWASTGIRRPTFESYNGSDVRKGPKIKNGIVPHAICTVLDNPAGSGPFVRELWCNIVGCVQQENGWRMRRDADKDPEDRLPPFLREQCAELWVSQPEPLSAAGPILDRLLFSV